MRKHGPKAPQCLGRDPRFKCRNIAGEIGAQEITPPVEAWRIALRQRALRVTAAQPERVQRVGAGLGDVERRQLPIGDTPGETFRRLAQEFDRCGAKQQEPADLAALAPPLVDQPAQRAEQIGSVLDLIENYEFVLVRREIERRIGELVAVSRVLKVEVD